MTRVGKLIILVEHEQLEFSIVKYFLLRRTSRIGRIKIHISEKKYFL